MFLFMNFVRKSEHNYRGQQFSAECGILNQAPEFLFLRNLTEFTTGWWFFQVSARKYASRHQIFGLSSPQPFRDEKVTFRLSILHIYWEYLYLSSSGNRHWEWQNLA